MYAKENPRNGGQQSVRIDHSTKSAIEPLDFAVVAAACLARAESLLATWLPDGKREGHEYIARNPTRADNSPGSFKVNLDTGKWADFATGDKGGDLVSLYAYLNHLSQGEAARALAELAGTIQPSPPGKSRQPKKKQAWHPVTPIPDITPPPPKTHYRYGTPTATWIYRNAAGQAVCYVYRFDPEGGKKEFLPLTFCRNEAGQTDWRWQALPTPRPLYNLDKLAANPEATIEINEGEKSADAGAILFPNMVAITSLNGCKSSEKADWTPCKGRHCVIWMDNDKPGRAYAETVTRLLMKAGAASVQWVNLTSFGTDLKEGWDAADALQDGWTPERVIELRQSPNFFVTPPEPEKTKGNGQDHDPPDREPPPVEPYEADARFQDTDCNTSQTSANVPRDTFARLQSFWGDIERVYIELVALSPVEYDRVREKTAKALGVRKVALDAEVKLVQRKLARQRKTTINPSSRLVDKPANLDNPLAVVKGAFPRLGYGGDLNLPVLLYLCCTSRLLSITTGNMLAHAQVVGPPAGGKNYVIDCVLSLFPKEAYLKIDAGSPKALIYSAEDLRHRIVIFTEADSLPTAADGSSGRSLADGDSRATAASALRNLASDGHLSFDIVERDVETGQFVTRHIEKEGPTLLLTTTTKAIGGQMGTRLWDIGIKEDDRQIKAALERRAHFELTRERMNPALLVQFQDYLQSKAPWDVIVPYAKILVDHIFYKGANPRVQRDFQRLLALIKSATIIRHADRQQDNDGRWVAMQEDYETVYEVLNESYAATVNDGLTEEVRAVVTAVEALVFKGDLPVTYTNVAARLGWATYRVHRKAGVALRHGWLVNTQEKRSQAAHLVVGEPMPDVRGLPKPEKLFSTPYTPFQNDCKRANAPPAADSTDDSEVW